MNFTDADAQRLISIIDQRIEERLRNERPRFGVVAAVDSAKALCSAYLMGETVYASPYIRYPNYLKPEVGDNVMVVASPTGERRLVDIFKTAGASFGQITAAFVMAGTPLYLRRTSASNPALEAQDDAGVLNFRIERDGSLVWANPSTGSTDTVLERAAASVLALGSDDSLRFGGDTDLSRVADGVLSIDGVRIDRPPAIRAERATTNQSISNNTATTVIYNSIIREDDEDAALSLNTSTGVITIATAGWYFVAASARFAANTTGSRHIFISHNGTTIARNASEADSAQWYVAVPTLQYFAASDTIEIQVSQDSGGSLDLIASAHNNVGVFMVRR